MARPKKTDTPKAKRQTARKTRTQAKAKETQL